MNSEHLIRGSFSNPPIVPLQHEHYQQFIPMQIPLPSHSVSANPHNYEEAVSLNRADVAKAFIQGQVEQAVAHTLIEDPKILMHEGQSGLHFGEQERQRGGIMRGARDKKERTDEKDKKKRDRR